MSGKILIPEWLKKENPICAGFCEMINEALQNRPNMSLAEFAEQLHEENVSESYRRLQAVVNKQLEDIHSRMKND
jgi:hypothetical protein